jgi:hypothetical protein
LCRHPRPRDVEGLHGDDEPLALLAQQVGGRDTCVLEDQLARGTGVDPHLALALAEREARRVLLDDERRRTAHTLLRRGQRHERVDIRLTSIGDEDLRAVQYVLVPVADGGHADRAGIASCRRLGQAESGQLLARCDLRQVLLFLFFGAVEQDREGSQAGAGEGQRDSGADFRQFLGHQAHVDDAPPVLHQSVVLDRDEHAEHVHLS